ncbi:hypothetical protein J7E79_09240 [Bacillus sp. ISL-40]|nr:MULTISPECIES: hypothetical protein [unclassified Bacillus (in: firmicutes)]MBT2697591.1 hypothetical protein [Bacillus sp. ISL-40]MBT2720858.1 hypothetical protein [Bacillus sp. ISL-46]MBT2742296.1 hypothetical protein [Bacillus sp. ISL-77]
MYPRETEILNHRQITIVSVEELDRIAEELGVESVLVISGGGSYVQ